MPTIQAQDLQDMLRDIFKKSGVRDDVAHTVAKSLVASNLSGHDSHGVIRVLQYLPWIEKGWIVPEAQLEVVREDDHLLILDGHLGFGQVIGRQACQRAIEKTQQHGYCLLTLRRSAHLGRVGEYMEMAAAAGVVAFSFTNTHGGGVLVAPYGGTERRLSANPLAAAAPIGDGDDMIMDLSTSVIAEGRIKVASEAGQSTPQGCMVDSDGHPTTDPHAFYADPPGALLPMAGHKGFALSLFAEVFAGMLTGAGCSQAGEHPVANGFFALFVDPARFCGHSFFREQCKNLLAFVKSSKRMAGYDEILHPGEPEARQRAQRTKKGINLDESLWSQLAALAENLDVSLPSLE